MNDFNLDAFVVSLLCFEKYNTVELRVLTSSSFSSDIFSFTEGSILREKCPYSEIFWSVFSFVWTGYGEILCISPYSVWPRKNTDQKKSKYRHFARCGKLAHPVSTSWFKVNIGTRTTFAEPHPELHKHLTLSASQ